MDSLTIIRPDDFHLHLRDDAAMKDVLQDTARQFARAIVMPNLNPPVTTVEQALSYRNRILACLPDGNMFEPLMTLYLTDNTAIEDVIAAADNKYIHGIKYYPAGATTNSDQGVTNIENVFPMLEKMTELGLPLLIHGEVTDADVDRFDREHVFIEKVLVPLIDRFKNLKMVFEHITTDEAVQFILNGPDTVAATITPHHLMFNRNSLFNNGLRPHYYCLPVLKRERHREAVLDAATSGHSRFFLGTDSAPHARTDKENHCGCAGIYSAHSAIEFYAGIFEEKGRLEKLEQFASINGANFYGLPINKDSITLIKQSWEIPHSLPFGEHEVIPLMAGESVTWKLLGHE
jgi:dihydroorotase